MQDSRKSSHFKNSAIGSHPTGRPSSIPSRAVCFLVASGASYQRSLRSVDQSGWTARAGQVASPSTAPQRLASIPAGHATRDWRRRHTVLSPTLRAPHLSSHPYPFVYQNAVFLFNHGTNGIIVLW